MGNEPLSAADEAFLDDVFDEVTTRLLNGEPVDPERLAAPRAHLVGRVVETVRLAAEICGHGAATMSGALPGFEVVRELGRGGMGSVFLAQQTSLGGRLVALKVLPQGAALSAQARARFRSEAQALARLRHANVIDVYDVVDSDVTPAYAMEWIDGRSMLELLDHWVAAGRPTDAASLGAFLGGDPGEARMARLVARWGLQVADALAAVHALGLLHRDVKPANVLVRRDGTAVLTDFGLVRDDASSVVTRSGAFLGTPAYASPEQLRGGAVDERADVYGLGATLYHALCGDPPFGERVHADMLRRVELGPQRALRRRAPWVDRDLATIVEAAMNPERERRYASAAALRDDLRRYLAGQPVLARPAGPWLRLGKYARRNRHLLGAAVGGSLLALLLAFGVALHLIRQSRIPAEVAAHVRQAHLALLDPLFDERMYLLLQGDAATRPVLASGAPRGVREVAHGELQLALGLRDDVATRAESDTLAIARGVAPSATFAQAAPGTHALADAWRDAAAPSVPAAELAAMSRLDRRCLGLLAFLRGADALCIDAWSGQDLAQEPDAFVDAALGQLYRQRGQPQLAWPRLERAFEHFGEAAFLAVAIGDVALQCGDPAYALRVLERVADVDVAHGIVDRVRGDALLALGRRDEARPLLLRHAARGNVPPSSHESLAAFFTAEGQHARAFHHRWRIVLRWPAHPGAVDGLGDVLAAWWGSLDGEGRRALLRGSLAAPGGFCDGFCRVVAAGSLTRWPQLFELARSLVAEPRALAVVRGWPAARRDAYVADVLAGVSVPVDFASAPTSLPLPLSTAPPELLSVGVGGQPADAACDAPAASADGVLVVFASRAGNLVANDDNGVADVFVRVRRGGVTRRLSSRRDGRAGAGASVLPAISADGRVAAFYSEADDLVPGDGNGAWDCFVCELASGAVACVSVGDDGRAAGVGAPPTDPPALSADGDRVLFVRSPARDRSQVVVIDRARGGVRFASAIARKPWLDAALTADGATAFASTGDGALLLPDDNQWTADVFAFDVRSGAMRRVSEVGGRQADLECRLAGCSPDGAHLLLRTLASNLTTIDAPGSWSLLRLDVASGAVARVDEHGGVGFDATGGAATASGRTVFASRGPRSRRAAWPQVWLHDGERLLLVSAAAAGEFADGSCGRPCISADGRFVAFATSAPALHGSAAADAAQIVGVALPR